MDDSLAGRLIVATPSLPDPNFEHAVVLLLQHEADGAVGVVVNRPSTLTVAETLPDWRPLTGDPPVVFRGGPVEPTGLLGLAMLVPGASADHVRVSGRSAVVDLGRDPTEVAPEVERVRIFAGYAGWGATQLETELTAGAWFLLDADPEDAFSDDPETLWREVLQRQGGLFATFPADPSLN